MKPLVRIFLIALLAAPLASNTSGPVPTHNNEIAGGAYATFAGKFGGDITTKELSETREVGVAGCASGSRIYTFDLHIYQGKEKTSFAGKTYKFTPDMIKVIRSMKKGDTFEFKKIKAHLPNGNSVDVVGRKFTVIS